MMGDPIFADAGLPDLPDRQLRDDEIDEDFIEALDAVGSAIPNSRIGGNGGHHPETPTAAEILALDTMRPRTTTDLLLDATPPPVSIVERILIAGTLLLIAGAPKVGKTWLALLLALCIVTGRPFLGFAVTERKKVLYLGGEGSDPTLRKRFQTALAFFPGIEDADLDNLLILSTLGRVKYDTPAAQEAIMRWVEPADVLIVDPDFRFRSKGDENSHADAREVQDFIDGLKAAGKTVIVVHHTRKAGPVDGGIAEIRGAGWGEFADSALVLQRKKAESLDRFILKFDLRHDEPVDDMELMKEGPLFIVADVGKRIVTSDDVVAVLDDAGGRIEGRTAMIEALARRTGCSVTSSTPKEAILKAERDGRIRRTTLPGSKRNIYFLKGAPE
ncbi:MAG: AAA family ATPase [bacterium]